MEFMEIYIFSSTLLIIISIIIVYKKLNSFITTLKQSQKNENIVYVTNDAKIEKTKKYDSAIVKLSFQEALSLDLFYNEMYNSSLSNLKEDVLDNLGLREIISSYPITYSLNKLSDGKIIFSLTEKGNALLKSGKAELIFETQSNKLLPAIRDSKTKEFIEQFKGKAPDLSSKVVNLTNAVVNVAHIISGADLAKQLKAVNKKLDYLLACRKMDQFSRLEANYNTAREIFSSSLNKVDRTEIRRLHQENMELRYIWRQEIEAKLSDIENPENYNWFKKKITRQKTINKKISSGLSELENELSLIDFSITYDIALTSVLKDEKNYFLNKTLTEEIKRLSNLSTLLTEKASYIKDKNGDSVVIPSSKFLMDIANKYKTFIPQNSEQEIEEATIISQAKA